jgi:hypothetical protein
MNAIKGQAVSLQNHLTLQLRKQSGSAADNNIVAFDIPCNSGQLPTPIDNNRFQSIFIIKDGITTVREKTGYRSPRQSGTHENGTTSQHYLPEKLPGMEAAAHQNTLLRIAAIVLAAVFSAFFVYFPITDTDIFWHLAAGKEMVRSGGILFTDPFAFSLASPQWIDLHWLFQLAVFGLHSLGGERALITFKLACVASTVILLCSIHPRRRYAVVASLISIVLFYNARYLICLRPVLITIVCMASYFLLFEYARRTERHRFLWLGLPLQVIWTNSQGLFMIGLFIISAYLFEEVVGWLRKNGPFPSVHAAVTIAASAGCLLNPWGIDGLRLPFRLLQRISPSANNIYSLNIAENVPLFSLSGYESLYTVTVAVTALIVIALFIINRKDFRAAHMALFAGFLYLAWSAERNVLLYIVAIIPIIGFHGSRCDVTGHPARSIHSGNKISSALIMIPILVIVLLVIRHSMVVAVFPPHRQLSPFRFPEKICDYLEQYPCEGRMFNDIRQGGYLIWRMYPPKQVFIDGRLIIRSPEFFSEYLAILKQPTLFTRVAEKFNITQVILPWAVFDLHHRLIQWLYHSDEWQLEYTDGASVLFVRKNPQRKPALRLDVPVVALSIRDNIATCWSDAPYVRREAISWYTEMLESLGCRESAQAVRAEGWSP